MMTLIGTLMTAVVSFYFGAMPKTPSDASRAPPELSGIENGTRPVTTGSQSLVLSGSNLNSTKAVRVVSGTTELEGSNILSSGSQISATLAPNAAFAVPGSWDVTVVDDIGRTASKKAWLTFSAPATPPATPPEIKPIGVTPLTAPASVTDFTITGSGLDAVTKVEAVPTTGGGAAIQATGLTKAADKLTFKLALTTGPWSVRIAAGTAQPIAVPGTITVA
jgi:hypothetical protein